MTTVTKRTIFHDGTRYDLFLLEGERREISAIDCKGKYYSAKVSPSDSLTDIYSIRHSIRGGIHLGMYLLMNNGKIVLLLKDDEAKSNTQTASPSDYSKLAETTSSATQSKECEQTPSDEIKRLHTEVATLKTTIAMQNNHRELLVDTIKEWEKYIINLKKEIATLKYERTCMMESVEEFAKKYIESVKNS